MEKDLISKKALRQVVYEYWLQYKKYPLLTGIAFILPAIGTILVFFIPPLILAKLIDIFITRGYISFEGVIPYIILFGGLWLLGEILWRIGMHSMIRLQANGTKNLSGVAFNKLANRDYGFYINNFVGTLANKSKSFIQGFESLTDTLQYNVVINIFTITFASIVLWQYSPLLPIILIGFMTLLIVCVLPIIKRRSKLVAIRHDSSSKMAGRLSDTITNMFAIKSFATESFERKHYGDYVDDYAQKFKKAADYHNLKIDTVLSPVYVATNVIGLIAAIFLASKLGLQPSVIIVVFSYYSQITRIFWEINHVYRTVESTVGGAAEFTQLFLDSPSIEDRVDAKPLVVEGGAIKFDAVNFKYGEHTSDELYFLKDFNLDIKSGQKVGLVGPSGGGKTTITKLVLRFIDVQAGHISIDGQAIDEVTQESLRKSIAYVPQDTLLFHRSLFENIAYGNPNATREEVIEAARLAHVHEFIEELPKSYHTLVGERGIKLSGGQRQRIAIARAMLKKSKILILDEATSALDSESEKYIQEGLLELMKDKTALVIAHRLSTIKHLDRIVVLDKGKVVQDGTHDELVAKKNGMYAKLWSHQSGGFIEEEPKS
jgi:ATP-binding cassette subfamily B protein